MKFGHHASRFPSSPTLLPEGEGSRRHPSANKRALPNRGKVHEAYNTKLVGPMKDAPFAML